MAKTIFELNFSIGDDGSITFSAPIHEEPAYGIIALYGALCTAEKHIGACAIITAAEILRKRHPDVYADYSLYADSIESMIDNIDLDKENSAKS